MTKAEIFYAAMKFLTKDVLPNDYYLFSQHVAKIIDKDVEIVDICDVSVFYDNSFSFTDKSIAQY